MHQFADCSTPPAPPGGRPEPPLQVRLVEELLLAQERLRSQEAQLDRLEDDCAEVRWWFEWLKGGLVRLLALMDPERWEGDPGAAEAYRQLKHCFDTLVPALTRSAERATWHRLAQHWVEATGSCLDPACVGCQARRFAWLSPTDQAWRVPCLAAPTEEEEDPHDTL